MPRFVAIDADAGGLFVAVADVRGGTVVVEKALAALDLTAPPTAETAPAVGARLKALLRDARVPAAPVLACVARDRLILKDVRYPKTAPQDEPAIVRFQSQKDLTEAADDLIMDYVPVPAAADDEQRRATVLFLRKTAFNDLKAVCDAAGLKLAGVVPRPYAAAAAVRRAVAAGAVPPPDAAAGAVAVLSVWDGGGEFTVSHGGQVRFARGVVASSLSSEAAFVGEVKRSLAGYAASHPGEAVQAVYLAEGAALGPTWAARLRAALPVPVHPFDPLGDTPADVPAAVRGRFLGPVGLLADRAASVPQANFASPRQPKAAPSKGRARLLLAALAAVVLVAGGGLAGTLLLSEQRRAVDELTAKQKKVTADATAEAAKARLLDAADAFTALDVAWSDVLYDATDQVPDHAKMRLVKFDGNVVVPPPVKQAPIPVAAPSAVGGAGSGAPSAKPAAPVAAPPRPGGVTAASKAADKRPVATVALTVLSESEPLAEKLKATLIQEQQHYTNVKMTAKKTGSGTKLDSFTFTADLFRRPVSDWPRKVTAVFPPKAAPPPVMTDPDPPFDPLDPLGQTPDNDPPAGGAAR